MDQPGTSPSAGSGVWETSVDELLSIFRSSLLALIPELERAKINWRGPSAYDDWDEIAQVLFRNIVAKSIEWAMPGTNGTPLNLPSYGVRYPDYTTMSFVEVVINSADHDREILAFIGYGTVEEPFDRVHAFLVDEAGSVLQPDLITVPVSLVRFRFRWRSTAHGLQALDTLSVVL